MSRGVLVTGTDTGIGKTLVGCALAAALSRRMRVGVLKPAETGCRVEKGELVPDDAIRLREAAGSWASLDVVCPFRYVEPLAPWLAADRAGRRIAIARVERCYAELRATSHVVIVESAGGLLVPLTERYSFADLAADLELTLLLVIGSRLGALNQALLTLECARRRHIAVAGYVLNRLTADENLAQRLNASALARLTEVPSLGEIPFIAEASTLSRERLAELGEPLALGLLQLPGFGS